MAGDILDFDGFPREGARNVNVATGAGCNAVAKVAEAIDQQALNHAGPR